jgi:general secretion pathway protein L
MCLTCLIVYLGANHFGAVTTGSSPDRNHPIHECETRASMMTFLRWWIDELASLLPARVRRSRAPVRRLVLALQGDAVSMHIEDNGRAAAFDDLSMSSAISFEALAEVLRSVTATRGRLPVCLRVRSSDGFVRSVDLPASAERDFDAMLRLDLERTTPLKASDVLSSHLVEGPGSGRGMVRVRHFVLKSRTIEPVQKALAHAGLELQSIETLDAAGTASLPLKFVIGDTSVHRAGWTLGRAVAAAATIFVLSVIGSYWARTERALASLDAEIAVLEDRAKQARPALDLVRSAQADIARARRLEADRQPAILILEEVTRLVPDTAWLQDLRYDGTTIEMSGLAVSAATLLPLFERSVLFHEARFTAPIRIEPGEDRERFRLQAKLRAPKPPLAGK